MSRIGKLFFDTRFTWPKVCLYALVCGVTCGLVTMCPLFENTSIHQFGVSVEAWILLGLPICTNSRKPLESSLKLFVFFLISQPLVYLTMWPVYQRFPWEYYTYWFYWTVACLPMGFLAWYIKREGLIGVLVVVLACMVQLYLGANYLHTTLHEFPQYLLAVLFCFAQVPLYICLFLHKGRERMVAAGVSAAVLAALLAFVSFAGPNSSIGYTYENASECTFEVEDEGVVEVTGVSQDSITLTARGYGSTTLRVSKPDGTTIECAVTVGNDGLVSIDGLHN